MIRSMGWPLPEPFVTTQVEAKAWGASHSDEQIKETMNLLFANRSEEEAIFPLTVNEIAESQQSDTALKKLTKKEKYTCELVENTK